jgi:hypothetical protein
MSVKHGANIRTLFIHGKMHLDLARWSTLTFDDASVPIDDDQVVRLHIAFMNSRWGCHDVIIDQHRSVAIGGGNPSTRMNTTKYLDDILPCVT